MAWTIHALPETACDCCRDRGTLIAPEAELQVTNGRPIVATVTGEYDELLGHEIVRVLRSFSEAKHGSE